MHNQIPVQYLFDQFKGIICSFQYRYAPAAKICQRNDWTEKEPIKTLNELMQYQQHI